MAKVIGSDLFIDSLLCSSSRPYSPFDSKSVPQSPLTEGHQIRSFISITFKGRWSHLVMSTSKSKRVCQIQII